MKKLAVPLIIQPNDYMCGPTSLDMVFRFFGVCVTSAKILQYSSTGVLRGTPRKGMIRCARAVGFHVHAQNDMTWKDLVENIAHGRPIIVNNRDTTDRSPHYSVVVGIDARTALVLDPDELKPLRIPRKLFESLWYGSFHTKHTHWGMVIWPK